MVGFLKWFGYLIWFDAVDFTIGAHCLLMPVSPFGVPAASQLVMHDTAVRCAAMVSCYNKMVWRCSASMEWPLVLL